MRAFLTVTKALSDETRVRALMALGGGELCLCQIIELLSLAPSTVSRHMSLLVEAGLVLRRKEGRWHFYRLAKGAAAPVARTALGWVHESLRRDPLIARDAKALRAIRRTDLEALSVCYKT